MTNDRQTALSQGETLLIRADAGVTMGTGHVMRCLALATAWQRRGAVLFAIAPGAPALEDRLRSLGIRIESVPCPPAGPEDAAFTANLARENGVGWAAIDGYHFDASFQERLRAGGCKLLLLDDLADTPAFSADMILNQNMHARAAMYAGRAPGARLLLGPQYVLLRQEFERWRGWQRAIQPVGQRVLVTFGGSDPGNTTAKVIAALDSMLGPRCAVIVVLGSGNPHRALVERAMESAAHDFVLQIDVPDMSELMAWADVAIAAAGSTSWELAFMGLPSLLVSIARNQVPLAAELDKQGIACDLGWHEELSPEAIATALHALLVDESARRTMSERGQSHIDGLGADRVLAHMSEGDGADTHIVLRRARQDDSEALWHWANDPVTREMSFTSTSIPRDEHEKWFEGALRDESMVLLIAETPDGEPMGTVRFTTAGAEATISINIAPGFRGRSLGAAMIRSAARLFFATSNVRVVHAAIKPENAASLAVFRRAGFSASQPITVRGDHALQLTLIADVFQS